MNAPNPTTLQLTAGRRDDQIYFYATVLDIGKARCRQP